MEERINTLKNLTADWMNSEFNPPATASQIEEFERKEGLVIPESYKEFLLLSNGAKLLGGDCYLYSVNSNDKFKVNYDLSDGNVPKELLIIGFYNSRQICFDSRYNSYIFYEYEDYDTIKDECVDFLDFKELLDYLIDIATN